MVFLSMPPVGAWPTAVSASPKKVARDRQRLRAIMAYLLSLSSSVADSGSGPIRPVRSRRGGDSIPDAALPVPPGAESFPAAAAPHDSGRRERRHVRAVRDAAAVRDRAGHDSVKEARLLVPAFPRR